ncbi:MAG: hypothetical protein AB2770_13220 [Candidatus Thiodiazotropha taylori]
MAIYSNKYIYNYHEKVLNFTYNAPGGNLYYGQKRYETQESIIKSDIIIFDDHLVIDSPLKSNGGDIIIFCNTITINAPIDSRVYFDHSEPAVVSEKDHQGRLPLSHYMRSDREQIVENAYNDYYDLTTDVWDDEKNYYSLLKSKLRPECPSSATVPCYPGRYSPLIVSKRPRFIFTKLKSGNITIFTNSLQFGEEIGRNPIDWDGIQPEFPELDIPGAPTFIKDYTMINARGIRGSRGGIPLLGCDFNTTNRSCLDSTEKHPRIRERWNPTIGGDAGNVNIYLTASDTSHDYDYITSRTGISKGHHGGSLIINATCFRDSKANASSECRVVGAENNGRAIFYPGQVDHRIPPGESQSGILTISHVTADYALSLCSAELIRIDGIRNVAYKSNIEATKRPTESIEFIAPIDHLLTYIRSIPRDLQIGAIANEFELNRQEQGSQFPSILDDIEVDSKSLITSTPGILSGCLMLLKYQNTKSNNNLYNYLADHKGLFELNIHDIRNELHWTLAHTQLNEVANLVLQLTEETLNLRYTMIEEIGAIREDEYRRRIEEIQLLIEQAEKKKKKEGDKLLATLQHFTNALSFIKQAKDHWTSKDWLSFSAPFTSIAVELISIDRIVKESGLDVERLRKIYSSLKNSYESFLQDMKDKRVEIFNSKQKVLGKIIKERRKLNDFTDSAIALQTDILKSALMTAISVGDTRESPTLRFNIRQLIEFSTYYPARMPVLNQIKEFKLSSDEHPKDISHYINNNPNIPIYKAIISRSSSTNTIIRLHKKHKSFPSIPLYYISSGNSLKLLDFYGLVRGSDIYIESL